MKLARVHTAILLAGALPFTGCQTYEEHGLTHKLWSDASLTDHYQPAGAAKLKAFARPPADRLLISYDERREKDSSLRRRAFYLPASAQALAEQRKPAFASSTPPKGSVEIPVILAGEPAPAVPRYLQLAANQQSFVVFHNGQPEGSHQLPTYVDPASTAFRVVMTPFAVAADATVIAVWCGVMALYFAVPR